MLKRIAVTLVVLALVPVVAFARSTGDVLARSLPADETVFYLELDVNALLEEGEKMAKFIDLDAGGKLVYQVNNLYGLLRELCARHEFEPKLFENVADVEVYLAVLAKDEPEVTVHTYKTPKWNPETWEPIEGEFEEHTYTQTKRYVFSVLARVPDEETAVDFLEEIKALVDREAEKEPGLEGPVRTDIEVERGELIGVPGQDVTFGRLGSYIILSSGNPRELWAALMAPPVKALSDTPLYRRMTGGAQRPQMLMLVNLQTFIRQGEDGLKKKLEEAQKKCAEKFASSGGGESVFDEDMFALMMAQAQYKAFMLFKELFSLDKCEQVGASAFFAADGERVVSGFTGLFSHGERISPVLEELLTGSGSFVLPNTGKSEDICVMYRADLGKIYDVVTNTIRASDPQMMGSFDQGMLQMKERFGVDLGEVLGLLAQDMYLFVNIVKKEMEIPELVEFDEETGEPTFETKKRMMMLPEVTMLWGVRDPRAARNTLSAVLTRMSTDPEFNETVKKRTYQETDVFCVGADVAEEDTYPDGLTSFAVVVVDRYLSFGSWDHITGLIRRMAAGQGGVDSELQSVVESYGNSNLLVVVPVAFQEKFQKLAESDEVMGSAFDQLLEALEALELDVEDVELAERLKASLRELILTLKTLDEKGRTLAQERGLLSGTHKGLFYELEAESEVSR